MSTPNWPIRVGGMYKNTTRPHHVLRVVAEVGDEYACEWIDTSDENMVFGGLDFHADSIRSLCLPEDQSPIPYLEEALENALARVNDLEIIINEARELGLTLFVCGDVWPERKKRAEAALAKAKEGVCKS